MFDSKHFFKTLRNYKTANGGQMATGVAVSRRTFKEIQQLEDRGLRSDILNGLHIEVRDELPDDTFNFNGLTPSCL
jgi:hypothetical protein